MKLYIKNKNNSKKVFIEGTKVRTELGGEQQFTQEVQLDGSLMQEIVFEMPDVFNFGFRLTSDKGDVDDVFIADGIWGLDYDENLVNIDYFDIEAGDLDRDADLYELKRNLSLKANATADVSVYRSLNAKFNSEDMSSLESLNMTADGNVILDVVLVHSGIKDWEAQPKTQIILKEESQQFAIKKSDFKAELPFDWSDIESINFKYRHIENSTRAIEIHISDLAFGNGDATSLEPLENEDISIQPNPFDETSRCLIHSEVEETYELMIIDAKGNILETKEGIFLKGLNEISLRKMAIMSEGMYFIQVLTASGLVHGQKFLISSN